MLYLKIEFLLNEAKFFNVVLLIIDTANCNHNPVPQVPIIDQTIFYGAYLGLGAASASKNHFLLSTIGGHKAAEGGGV